MLAVVICLFSTFVTASAASEEDGAATKLNVLGLFQVAGEKTEGTSDTALDRPTTRAEMIIMLVRMIAEVAANTAEVVAIEDHSVPMAELAPVQPVAPVQTPGASQFEREVFILINLERTNHGLEALEWDSRIAGVARAHSVDMSQRGYFNHINLEGLRPGERKLAADIKFRYSAENIARGFRTPEDVVAAWMASPSHRDAILSKMPSLMGIGVHNNHWTANFVGF